MARDGERFVRDEVGKTVALLNALLADATIVAAIAAIAVLATDAVSQGHKILFAGNGGSAADAQHLAAELVGKLNLKRRAIAALALTTDSSILTAIGNDFGFDEIFSRQVEALGNAGDVLVAISTSGRSPNVLKALGAARARGMKTVGLTGAGGAEMAALCDAAILVPTRETQKIQEAHIVVGHIVCGLVETAAAAP